MQYRTIGILGGSGFVGQHLSALLAQKGYQVRLLCRDPLRHPSLNLIEHISVIKGDPFDEQALEVFFEGLDVAINLVGILNEKRDNGQDFDRIHVDLAHRVVLACRKKDVKRLLHMSALNASKDAHSYYLRSKGEAEDWVHDADGLLVTSFRPSVIFGPSDSFFNRFAGLLKITPLVFPLACAKSRFAPVYIDDVCKAFCTALENPHTIGQRYSLCGPQIFTLQELVQYTASQLQCRTRIIALPNILSRLQARVLSLLPGKPFTLDNYRSLQTDSVCSENGLIKLGIKPVSIHAIVPAYLSQDNRKGRLDQYRKQRSFSYRKRY